MNKRKRDNTKIQVIFILTIYVFYVKRKWDFKLRSRYRREPKTRLTHIGVIREASLTAKSLKKKSVEMRMIHNTKLIP